MIQPWVFIFRGAPASGKTSLAPKFCAQLRGPIVLLEQDKFRWGFHLTGRQVADVQAEEHVLAQRNLVAVYQNYLRAARYTIVLEGLFTWDDPHSPQGNMRELVAMAERYGYSWRSVVLRASQMTLRRRNDARDYSVPRPEFDSLYQAAYRTIGQEELVIDSENQQPGETLAEIMEGLQPAKGGQMPILRGNDILLS